MHLLKSFTGREKKLAKNKKKDLERGLNLLSLLIRSDALIKGDLRRPFQSFRFGWKLADRIITLYQLIASMFYKNKLR